MSESLTGPQFVILIITGIILWFLAALLMRWIVPMP